MYSLVWIAKTCDAVLSALLIRIKFKQDKSPICLPYTTKFKVKKLSDFWKFYLFSRQYYKLTLAHFLLELSKVKITSFKSTTEIIIRENVNLVFSSVCFEKINNFSSVNPPNCPPSNFEWGGQPQKMWYYPIITVRILRTNELCVFQTLVVQS